MSLIELLFIFIQIFTRLLGRMLRRNKDRLLGIDSLMQPCINTMLFLRKQFLINPCINFVAIQLRRLEWKIWVIKGCCHLESFKVFLSYISINTWTISFESYIHNDIINRTKVTFFYQL